MLDFSPGAKMGLGGILLLIASMCRPRHGGGRRGIGNCFRYHHSTIGIFSGYTIAGTAIIALSSTVLAGVRRATGLTIRRQLCWPAINVESGERWLAWCNSRLQQLNEKAERHVAMKIAKFGPDIDDPVIRELWEKQLRADVSARVEGMRSRVQCLEEMVNQAKEAKMTPSKQKKMHPPMLAAYLWIGERIFDWLVGWMKRNPHFCLDSGFVTGQEAGGNEGLSLFDEDLPNVDDEGMAFADDSMPFASMPEPPSSSIHDGREAWRGRGGGSSWAARRGYRGRGRGGWGNRPTAYVARTMSDVGSMPAMPAMPAMPDISPTAIPEPSAPQLNEKDALRAARGELEYPSANSSGTASSSSHAGLAHNVSINAQYSQPTRSIYTQAVESSEPPPYTPVEDDEQELAFMN